MRSVNILSVKNKIQIADKCLIAERFFDRLRGLIGKKAMKSGEGMLLKPCNDIHMWFMSIPIDVVFVSRESESQLLKVTSVHENVRPWKILPLSDRKASETIELPIGTIQRCEIRAGDLLCIS
jgi:uncharacterized protein